MSGLAGLFLAGLIAVQAAPESAPQSAPRSSPPIFQPGAPGAPARVISPAEALALGRTSFTADDVAFMQHMVVHHGQAVEMVDLLQTRGSDPTVRLLARRIALSQAAEIDLMRDWLSRRGQSLAMQGMDHSAHAAMDHSAHAGHAMPAADTPVMAGMLSPRQMQALAAADGTAFDRLFLQGMIQHHQGAIDMVEALMTRPNAAQDSLLSDFASAVVADQSAEIRRMQSLLSDLSNPVPKERP